jgi:hypothetical protein
VLVYIISFSSWFLALDTRAPLTLDFFSALVATVPSRSGCASGSFSANHAHMPRALPCSPILFRRPGSASGAFAFGFSAVARPRTGQGHRITAGQECTAPFFSAGRFWSGLLLWDCQSLLDLLEHHSKSPLRRSLSGRLSGIVLATCCMSLSPWC